MARRYWLFKSEPDVFSFDDLMKAKNRTSFWDGVRNYQARNLLRDEIKKGDLVYFYHSSTDPQVIAGVAEVVKEGTPDPSQFDPKSEYHDADSTRDSPRWFGVEIKGIEPLGRPVTLKELRTVPGLGQMMLLRKGARLSVQPVTAEEWKLIDHMARRPAQQ